MAERVAVREISNEEGRKHISIVRGGSGSVVRWRGAQIVLWSAQHMGRPGHRHFCLDGTDHEAQAFLNLRYIA